ncbi:hypothetical protein [uncultured Roseovarius sp.]|uniref:hypothetical protein n=1 Tax=uncultured Roseovarius sp. TaxID=293344 RepID=UPI0025F19DE5|nr:hypothetical protein [uncultured Roseovarius sp.]
MCDYAERRQRLQAFVRSQAENGLPVRTHPDSHLLNDWVLYGPRDARIEQLVSRLALDHGLRVAEIEDLIVAALGRRLAELANGDQWVE